ncbi:MAG: radical SAM family heme chaperone HemW [Roseovarius sp.]
MTEDWRIGGFGLYIHWPFCEAKCPYCDFNSHVRQDVDQKRWLRAYIAEIERHASLLPGRVLNSIYFGGGTPSLMAPELVAEILARVRRLWPAANDLEVTLEANPGSVEAGRLAAYAQAGVSRVSLGVQALNARDLRRLGRVHSLAEAMQAIDIANTFFQRVSFDLIYARPGQSLADWRAELGQALRLAGDHLSLYQLTIEPGTVFGARHARGALPGLPDEELGAALYTLTQELCDAAGLCAYEVSNHARSGSESRHNLIYWRCGDYVGVGPGAHGRITIGGIRHATETHRLPETWLTAAEAGNGDLLCAPVPPAEQAEELLLMGLRLSEGIDMRRFRALSGRELSATALAELQGLGMVAITGDRLRATTRGRLVLNAVIRALVEG